MTYLHSISQGHTPDSSDQSDSRWWPGPRVARFLLVAVWQYCYWQCRAVSHSFIFTRPSQLRPSTIKWEWGRTKGDKLYCSAMFRHSCDVTLLPSWRDFWFKYMLDLYTVYQPSLHHHVGHQFLTDLYDKFIVVVCCGPLVLGCGDSVIKMPQ